MDSNYSKKVQIGHGRIGHQRFRSHSGPGGMVTGEYYEIEIVAYWMSNHNQKATLVSMRRALVLTLSASSSN